MKRINKLTEGFNLLWESSRMILPEHKERIRSRRDEARRGGRQERPELDEQELERINEVIAQSLCNRTAVRLQMYDPLEDCIVEGIVEEFDPMTGHIRVNGDWFDTKDIVGVE